MYFYTDKDVNALVKDVNKYNNEIKWNVMKASLLSLNIHSICEYNIQ